MVKLKFVLAGMAGALSRAIAWGPDTGNQPGGSASVTIPLTTK